MDIFIKNYRLPLLLSCLLCALLFTVSQRLCAKGHLVEYTRDASKPKEWSYDLYDIVEEPNVGLKSAKVTIWGPGGGAGSGVTLGNPPRNLLGGNGGAGGRIDMVLPVNRFTRRIAVNFGLPGKAPIGTSGGQGGQDVYPAGKGGVAGEFGGAGGGGGSAVELSIGGVGVFVVVGGGGGGGGATRGFDPLAGGDAGEDSFTTYIDNPNPDSRIELGTPLPYSGGGGGGGGTGLRGGFGGYNGIDGQVAAQGGIGARSGIVSSSPETDLKATQMSFYKGGGSAGGKANSTIASERDGQFAKIVITNKGVVSGILFADFDATGVYPQDPQAYPFPPGNQPTIRLYRATGIDSGNPTCQTSQFLGSHIVLREYYGVEMFFSFHTQDDKGNDLITPGDYCLYVTAVPEPDDFDHSYEPPRYINGVPIRPVVIDSVTNGIARADGIIFRYFQVNSEGVVDEKSGGANIGFGRKFKAGLSIKGRVFNDINHNGIWDNNESAPSGLSLYLKLVSANSAEACRAATTATKAVAVNQNGTYELTAVTAGSYCLILTDSSALTNLTPFSSDKWWYTQNAGGRIYNVVMANTSLENNNFGLTETPLVQVSGRVYNDKNSDAIWDSGDTAIGLELYAKLVSTTNQCTLVDMASTAQVQKLTADGHYAFNNVTAGQYCIILSDSASNTLLTPYLAPKGWWYTENRGGVIRITVVAQDIMNNNFGLTQSLMLRGKVFIDNGAGGGIPYDGIQQDKELAVAKAQIELFAAAVGNNEPTLLQTVTTAPDGEYVITLPNSTAENLEVRVLDPLGKVSVSQCLYASQGNPAVAACKNIITNQYSRFPVIVSDLNVAERYLFGVANVPTFESDQSKYARPAGYVNFFQTLTSYASGSLVLSYRVENDNVVKYPFIPEIYLDNNCNGQLDVADNLITGAIPFKLNERKCFITRIAIPSNYPIDEKNIVGRLTASFTYGNATRNTIYQSSVTLTILLGDEGQGVSLFKTVDKTTARPGELLNYSIEYRNHTETPIDNLVIRDKLDPYTDLIQGSAKCDAADQPTGVTCSIRSILPEDNSEREIMWIFNNPIPALSRGKVKYQLRLHL